MPTGKNVSWLVSVSKTMSFWVLGKTEKTSHEKRRFSLPSLTNSQITKGVFPVLQRFEIQRTGTLSFVICELDMRFSILSFPFLALIGLTNLDKGIDSWPISNARKEKEGFWQQKMKGFLFRQNPCLSLVSGSIRRENKRRFMGFPFRP